MHVALTVELTSWVLGFGKEAEVLEPDEMRQTIESEAREMMRMYQGRDQ